MKTGELGLNKVNFETLVQFILDAIVSSNEMTRVALESFSFPLLAVSLVTLMYAGGKNAFLFSAWSNKFELRHENR